VGIGGHRGDEVNECQNFVDVVYGWPLNYSLAAVHIFEMYCFRVGELSSVGQLFFSGVA